MVSSAASSSISTLIAGRRQGYALPRDLYLRPEVFARDLDLLLGRWTCVGHISELPESGDWITAELGGESVIVARGQDGALNALANVCRHRGSRICLDQRGSGSALVCPYHAWSYHLDGRLRAAREMPAGFVAADHNLRRLPLAEIGGLLFVSLGENPPDLSLAAPALAEMCARYGWPTARIAHRATFSVASNWKLALENYHECYHCAPSHPEFSVLHALARPGQRTLKVNSTDSDGHRDTEDWDSAANGREVVRVMRSRLADGCLTGSADGKLMAPPMGPLDQHCVFGELGFLSAFLAYADYGVIYRFLPRGPRETAMEVIWLVRGDAVEGRDYNVDALTWLWTVTSIADKTIIENNQAGVASRFYEPGPFSEMEPGARAYVERYIAELSAIA